KTFDCLHPFVQLMQLALSGLTLVTQLRLVPLHAVRLAAPLPKLPSNPLGITDTLGQLRLTLEGVIRQLLNVMLCQLERGNAQHRLDAAAYECSLSFCR